MEIKRLKEISINGYIFTIKWDEDDYHSSFDYLSREVKLGVKSCNNADILDILCHELHRICVIELHSIFTSFHYKRTLSNMFSGLIYQFIK